MASLRFVANGFVSFEIEHGMKIDHIGIATNGIEEAAKWWRDALGVDFGETEEVAEQKVRVAKLPLGESSIELLEPVSADSPTAKFLHKLGPRLHPIPVPL